MSEKPWEQVWEAEPDNLPRWLVYSGREFVANTLAGDDEEKAKFIATAPRLYRALEALSYRFTHVCGSYEPAEFIEARAALKAARGEE